MWIHYPDAIEESPDDLARLEKSLRGNPVQDRLKMLRLLKTQAYPSQSKLAEALGYSDRQLRRWWKRYRDRGLAGLLDRQSPPGRSEQVTPEALEALEAQMKQGHIARLEDAQCYLREHWQIDYRSLNGISALFKRHKIKLKTGRRRDKNASSQEQAAFKK